MFFHNTRYKFALPPDSPDVAGGIIAASAMAAGQLTRRIRRDVRKFPYLRERLFDPQLYLCSLDPNASPKPVANLATYPWFGQHDVPDFDSEQHQTLKNYKDIHGSDLLGTWRRQPLSVLDDIRTAARACVALQLELGCRAVILPSPLTVVTTRAYHDETVWLDAGVDACRELNVSIPVFATIAISDSLLRGADPARNPLLHTITNQIAARSELAGAYVVVEQAAESGYACSSRESLISVLILAHDLIRGAGRQIVMNYLGTFGAVASAAGVETWASGYYRSQRRLRLSDMEDAEGRSFPRYYSYRLAGDIGVQDDIKTAYRAGLGARVLWRTTAGLPLENALAAGTYPDAVPEWAYRPTQIAAAAAHYLTVQDALATRFDSFGPDQRVERVDRWLQGAKEFADELRHIGISSTHTDLNHQGVWLEAFREWREYARL